MASCANTNTQATDGSAAETPHEGGEPSRIERGVRNPRVIDLITPIPGDTPAVELLMVEDRAWGSDPAQLDQLQEKLNNYLDYVLDGFLAQQYPAYAGRKVRIALECVEEPKGAERGLLEAIERYLVSTGLEFRLAVKAP